MIKRIGNANVRYILVSFVGTPILALALFYILPFIPFLNQLSPNLWQAFTFASIVHLLYFVTVPLYSTRKETTRNDIAVLAIGLILWISVTIYLYLYR